MSLCSVNECGASMRIVILMSALSLLDACGSPEPIGRSPSALESADADTSRLPATVALREGDGDRSMTPRVVLTPSDLMTAVGDATPAAVVHVDGGATPEQLAALRQALSLVTWPARRVVPTRFVHTPPDPGLNRYEDRIELVPETQLEAGWYGLRCESSRLPGFEIIGATVPDGHVSRFRPDSFPVVSAVSVTRGDVQTQIVVELSERVRDSRQANELVAVRAGGLVQACQPAVNGGGLQHEQGARALVLSCPLMDADADVTVRLAPGIRALGGRPVLIPFAEPDAELVVGRGGFGAPSAAARIFPEDAR